MKNDFDCLFPINFATRFLAYDYTRILADIDFVDRILFI